MSKKKTSKAGGASANIGEDAQDQTPDTNEEMLTKEQVQALIDDTTTQLKEATEQQVGQVRSDLMRAQNIREKEWAERDEARVARIRELETKDMDEDQKAAYTAKRLAEENAELRTRLGEVQSDLQAASSMGAYVQAMSQSFDLEASDIDMTNPDTASASAFEAATKRYADLKEKYLALEQTQERETPALVDDKPPVEEPPDVVTETGRQDADSGSPTLEDLREQISRQLGLPAGELISMEQLFDMAENPEETGVDLNVVLPALEAEEAKKLQE
jgi:hypothetical protein